MKKSRRLRKENQVGLLKYEQKACREVISVLRKEGWGTGEEDIYLDEDWGWTILSDKHFLDFGVVIRRARPFQLSDKSDRSKADALQEKLRKDLVEVYPYILKADKNRNTKVELLEPSFSLS